MAKKFVRGVTGVEDIESFDKTLTNVNDIVSDGQDTYVHTKKGKTESYYKLTDSLKSISSEDSDLLTVSSDETTNTATLHPKHDTKKEQLLESTRSTVTIQHGENATTETTKIDTNPQKVLEHEKLLTGYGINKTLNNDTSTLYLQPFKVASSFDVNTHFQGKVVGENLIHAPANGWFVYENDYMNVQGRDYIIQTATRFKLSGVSSNEKYTRTLDTNTWSPWSKLLTDESVLASKQNTLTNSTSIGVKSNNSLAQLFYYSKTYTNANGLLKTTVKNIASSSNVDTLLDEYSFIVKLNQSVSSITFDLNYADTVHFNKIFTLYGVNNTVRISGCVFSLSESTLTVSTSNNTQQNYVITFSHIV